ncbi:MAG: prephenate dehydrogenase [Clostridia bacterium]|nr:prephenate dehydrogenase [Clostridia bacterium]
MKFDKNSKILIVGLGLIGGSYAQALTDKGYYVGAIARRAETVEYALSKKLIASGTTEVTRDYVSQFDIIVFALYPKIFIEWIEKYQDYIKDGAILTDVTGVKRSVVYDVQRILKSTVEFIGAHPMAGKEVYGVENSDKRIFENANYIVTPTDDNTGDAIEICKKLGHELGFKTVTQLTPEKHDEMIGFLSQLTHCIAVSLMDCKESKDLVDYTGDSFRDLTRIAKINDAMWSELFLLNKDELLKQMDLFSQKFAELRNTLENEDINKMREMMRISTERRKYFDKK